MTGRLAIVWICSALAMIGFAFADQSELICGAKLGPPTVLSTEAAGTSVLLWSPDKQNATDGNTAAGFSYFIGRYWPDDGSPLPAYRYFYSATSTVPDIDLTTDKDWFIQVCAGAESSDLYVVEPWQLDWSKVYSYVILGDMLKEIGGPSTSDGSTTGSTTDATATTDSSADDAAISPYCDLVAISYVDIKRNQNGTLIVGYSWDKKEDSYFLIEEPVIRYAARHGPLKRGANGKYMIDPETMTFQDTQAKDGEYIPLVVTYPTSHYGLQLCAVTRQSSWWLLSNDWWASNGPIGTMDLHDYILSTTTDQSTDDSQITATTASVTDDSTTDGVTYRPECDLVKTSHVKSYLDAKTNTLTMWFDWEPKQSSYDSIDKLIDYYLVRHGPETEMGAPIDPSRAQFKITKDDRRTFDIKGIPPGGYYGLQICAINNDFRRDGVTDWISEAKLNSFDFRNLKMITDAPIVVKALEIQQTNNTIEIDLPFVRTRPMDTITITSPLIVGTTAFIIFLFSIVVLLIAYLTRRSNKKQVDIEKVPIDAVKC